jgi:flagellar brake protein
MLEPATEVESNRNDQNFPDLFRIDAAREILAALREIAAGAGPTAVALDDSFTESVPVRVMRIEADRIELELGAAPNHTFADTRDLYLIADRDRVRVTMKLGDVTAIADSNWCCYRSDLPATIYRIQRRDGFRVRPSAKAELVCRIRGAQYQANDWPVFNMSVIGVALRLPPGASAPPIGSLLRHSQIVSDTQNPIPADLLVRRHWTLEAGNDATTIVGCQFERLDSNAERQLQVLITQIERDQRRHDVQIMNAQRSLKP